MWSWTSEIIPTLVVLLVAMNSLVKMIGNDKIEKFAGACAGNPITRYIVLPVVGIFFLLQSNGFIFRQTMQAQPEAVTH